MGSRCCCGCCSLTAATNVVAIICVIQCIFGIFWNVQLLMVLEGSSIFEGLLNSLILVEHLQEYDVIHGLTMASLGLHVLWLFFAILIARANASLNRGLLTPWVLLTYLVTMFDIGSTIFFAVKFQVTYTASPYFYEPLSHKSTAALTYLTLMVLFSRGIIVWFLDVYFAHVVERRGKEIDHNNSVLALYILSHLSRGANSDSSGSGSTQEERRCPTLEPPRYFHTSYLPRYLLEGSCQEGRGSSWSLNQEAVQGIVGFANPLYPRLAPVSLTDLQQQQYRASAGKPPNAPAYGPPNIEQSQRFSQGVLPY